MKYKMTRIFMVLLLLLVALALPVQASEYTFVYDDAMLLTTTKAAELENMAAQTAARYGCGIYIVTMYDYLPYGSTVRSAAENFFLTHDLGLGSDDNGVLLLLSMAERDYALIAHGNIGNAAFTDYGITCLSDRFLPDLGNGFYADAFETFARGCDEYISLARNGTPFDVGSEPFDPASSFLIAAVIGLIAAWIVVGSMKAQLKSVRQQNAGSYLKEGSLQLTDSRELYLYRNVHRTVKQESSSGGSSTHRSSSGRSHGGGGGKF